MYKRKILIVFLACVVLALIYAIIQHEKKDNINRRHIQTLAKNNVRVIVSSYGLYEFDFDNNKWNLKNENIFSGISPFQTLAITNKYCIAYDLENDQTAVYSSDSFEFSYSLENISVLSTSSCPLSLNYQNNKMVFKDFSDNNLTIMNLQTKEQRKTHDAYDYDYVSWSHDSSYLVVTISGKIYRLFLETGRKEYVCDGLYPEVLLDNTIVFWRLENHQFYLIRIDPSNMKETILLQNQLSHFHGYDITPDGRYLAITTEYFLWSKLRIACRVYFWDLKNKIQFHLPTLEMMNAEWAGIRLLSNSEK